MLNSKTFKQTIKSLAFAGISALGVASAHAGFTSVVAPQGAELSQAQILSQTYGGTFNASGMSYTNGTVTATRVADDDLLGSTGAMLQLLGGGGDSDQCWGNGVISARAIARYAGYGQSFGYLDGDAGGAFHELFTVTGFGLNVSGAATDVDLSGKEIRFARGGDGEMHTSLKLDNFGGEDAMVSYRLTGPNGVDKYVLFFEDRGSDVGTDWDFNDLVVEVTARPGVNAVPLPPAAWTGLAVLATAGIPNIRRRLAQLLK